MCGSYGTTGSRTCTSAQAPSTCSVPAAGLWNPRPALHLPPAARPSAGRHRPAVRRLRHRDRHSVPIGGIVHGAAAVVFGLWFITCLILAVRAIRRDDMFHHRRWMIRAFAVGIAVGTIRIWVGLFLGLGLLDFEDAFAPAFWISFSLLHAAAGCGSRQPTRTRATGDARARCHITARTAVDDDFFEDSE